MNRDRNQSQAQGAALILVLVSLLALSGLVLRTTEITSRGFEDISLLVLEYKAGLKAQSGLEKGLSLLNHADTASKLRSRQVWPPTWEHRGLHIHILPCSGKLNINNLTRNPEDRKRMEQAILDIFRSQDLTRTDLDHLLTWMGSLEADPLDPHEKNMRQALSQRSQDVTPPGRPLLRPEELLLVPGFAELSPTWIRRFFTVWGQPGKINLNFASREIVMAFIPELEPYWERIQDIRRDTGITHPNQLLTAVGLDMTTYLQILPFLSWEATYFEVRVESQEGGWYNKYRYIVQQHPITPGSDPQVLVRDTLQAGVR
ncbi:MAG: type II secretion system protein GspK [Desulfovermiculus sp.]|nr:type II secretion system protein GspK [Desulfovermiculus sp.]